MVAMAGHSSSTSAHHHHHHHHHPHHRSSNRGSASTLSFSAHGLFKANGPLASVGSTVGEAIPQYIPGFKTSASTLFTYRDDQTGGADNKLSAV
jgi:hypothetical protein